MDAVIAQHKPRMRIAAPSRTPWSTWTASQEGPSDHRWHLTTPEQLATASSRIVLVSPQDAWWALGATVASLARHGHPVLVVEVNAQSAGGVDARKPMRHPTDFPHQTLTFDMPAGAVPEHEKALAEWLPVGSGDTVFVPWRHDGTAVHEACARATLAACRTVNARCIEFPANALDPSHMAHQRLRRSVLQCVRVQQAAGAPLSCEWTIA
jgi:LmbE family N-acetylglucosaminyl deacetylase